MDRKSKSRIRLVSLRPSAGEDKTVAEGPRQELVGIELGYRILISEQAEVWTLVGSRRDGTLTQEEIGELCFVLIPGTEEPATAVTGFIAPAAPYALTLSDEALQEQLRDLVTQLGYDKEGFYISLGIGGRFHYDENYRRE